jgi:hypothetical protein
MNIIQEILVGITLLISVIYIIRKYGIIGSKKNKCNDDNNCGCN